MKRTIFLLCLMIWFGKPLEAQPRNYNCVILDSLFSTIHVKKQQNDLLFPLFKSGEIKKTRDSILVITKDVKKRKEIDSILSRINLRDGTLFLDDVLFSLDTFNIVIDTFGFFNSSCNADNKNYLVVNDYRILSTIKVSSNVVVVQAIGHNNSGAISIALRNTKSNFVVIVGIRQSSMSFPRVSILGKHLFDAEDGTISLE